MFWVFIPRENTRFGATVATVDVTLPDGTSVRIPEFALERTQNAMHKLMKKQERVNVRLLKTLDSIASNLGGVGADNRQREAERRADRRNQELLDALDELTAATQESRGGIFSTLLSGSAIAAKAVTGFAAAVTGAAVGLGAFAFQFLKSAAINDFTENMERLNQAGLGLEGTLSASIQAVVMDMQRLGFTAQESSALLSRNSAVSALMGRNLGRTIRQFNILSDTGSRMGMGFREANDALLTQLDLYEGVGALNMRTANEQASAATRQIKMQRVYSTIMGRSMEELQRFARDTIEDNAGFLLAVRMNGAQTLDFAQSFITRLYAQGDAVGRIAKIFMDAAGRGAVSMSDQAVDLMTVLPESAEALQMFHDRIRRGLYLNDPERQQQDMNDIIEGSVRNLTQDRLMILQHLMDAGIDGVSETAATLVRAHMELVQADKNRIKALELYTKHGLNANLAAKSMQDMDEALNALSGSYDAFKAALAITFVPVVQGMVKVIKSITPHIQRGFEYIGQGVDKFVRSALKLGDGDLLEEVSKAMGTTIEVFASGIGDFIGNTLPGIMTSVKEFFKGGYIEGFIDNFKSLLEYVNTFVASVRDEKGMIRWDALVDQFGAKFDSFVDRLIGRIDTYVSRKLGSVADTIDETIMAPGDWLAEKLGIETDTETVGTRIAREIAQSGKLMMSRGPMYEAGKYAPPDSVQAQKWRAEYAAAMQFFAQRDNLGTRKIDTLEQTPIIQQWRRVLDLQEEQVNVMRALAPKGRTTGEQPIATGEQEKVADRTMRGLRNRNRARDQYEVLQVVDNTPRRTRAMVDAARRVAELNSKFKGVTVHNAMSRIGTSIGKLSEQTPQLTTVEDDLRKFSVSVRKKSPMYENLNHLLGLFVNFNGVLRTFGENWNNMGAKLSDLVTTLERMNNLNDNAASVMSSIASIANPLGNSGEIDAATGDLKGVDKSDFDNVSAGTTVTLSGTEDIREYLHKMVLEIKRTNDLLEQLPTNMP